MDQNRPTYMPETLAGLQREELRHLLTAELEKEPVEIDDSLVRLLLRELENRGKDTVFTDDEAVEAACEKFRLDAGKDRKPRGHWYQSWLVKAASVVMVLGVLLFTLPGAAEAGTVADVLTRWTDSIFHFFSPGEPAFSAEDYVFKTDNPGLQQIYDAVTELGITDPVVPMWVPEGFELQEIEVFDLAEDQTIFARLRNSNNLIYITITMHGDEVTFQHEKNTQKVETIDLAGIEHYIMSNSGEYIITWWINEIECSVVSDCQEDEIIKLLKSIYTSEG